MGTDNKKKQLSQAMTHVLCLTGGAVVSAAICGIIVTRKIQAYANVLKKASEGSEARNKEKAKELKAAAKPAPSPCKENVLLPYKPFEELASPFDAKVPSTAPTHVPVQASSTLPAGHARIIEVPESLRSSTAPLPKASSAMEEALPLEPKQDTNISPCTPFAAPFTQTSAFVPAPPPQALFETSSLFQTTRSSSAPMDAAPLQASKLASHTVHQDKVALPPRVPNLADQRPGSAQPAFDTSVEVWQGSQGGMGSAGMSSLGMGSGGLGSGGSLGMRSRTTSSDLDNMRGIPQLLRTRLFGQPGTALPELGALLGRGSFGKVYKGRWKGAMVAVKIIEHSADINSKIEGLRETMVSSNIQHPNVLITYKVITCGQHGMISGQQMGSLDSASGSHGQCPIHVVGQPPKPPLGTDQHADFEEIQETWLLSEFCDKGNMDRALSGGRFHDKASGKPEMVAIYRCLLDVAAGMDYLHSLGVLHGDLKGGNVLMKSTSLYDDPRGFVCKIGDFGLSRVLEHNSTHISTNTYGTVSYCSPELLKEGKLTKAADVYSFAMIMWEMYSGTALFSGMNSSQVFFKVIMGYRPTVPPDMPEGFTTLMKACWHEKPEERPPFEDIVAYLRSLYLDVKNGKGETRDARRSLDLNPWG